MELPLVVRTPCWLLWSLHREACWLERISFLQSAWAAATTGHPRVVCGGKLQAGDVLFFYTQRIHRAPRPPAAGSPRYTLFGAFCKQGKTDGAPVVQATR